jgi:hypothetical protein
VQGLLKDKTRLLVTHNLGLLPDVDRIVLMGTITADGSVFGPDVAQNSNPDTRGLNATSLTIIDQGTLQELVARGHDLGYHCVLESTWL